MIFFIGYDLILLFLIFCFGGVIAMTNILSDNLCFIIAGLLIIATMISTIFHTCVQKDENGKSFSFWVSLVTTALYIPYFIFMFESMSVDKSRYILSFIKSDNLEDLLVPTLLFLMVIIIVPQLISYIPNSVVNKVFSTIPIIVGIIMVIYVWNTVGDSYNNYYMERYKNEKHVIVNSVVEDADVYLHSAELPLTVYPFFSPIKLTNGCIEAGSEVKVIDKGKDLYENYVRVVTSDKVGFIKRDLLKDEISWRGY